MGVLLWIGFIILLDVWHAIAQPPPQLPPPSCKPDQQATYAIDWWFIRKLPNTWDYLYMDSQSQEVTYVGGDGLIGVNSAMYQTLDQLPSGTTFAQNINDYSWIFYNDQPGGAWEKLREDTIESSAADRGHAKGVLAFQQDPTTAGTGTGGFHMTHSIPAFPRGYEYSSGNGVQWSKPTPPNGRNPEWIKNARRRKGQSLFCYNINAAEVDNVLLQLIWMDALFYHFNIDENHFGNYPPNVANFLTIRQDRAALRVMKANAVQAGCADPANSGLPQCMNEIQFTNARYFAKTAVFGDLGAMVADRLQTSLISVTQTKIFRGTLNLNSVCGVAHNVYDGIEYHYPFDSFTFGQSWQAGADHSKIMFVETPDPQVQNWVCVSDLNRYTANAHRGGGAVCFRSYATALLLDRMTFFIDACQQGASGRWLKTYHNDLQEFEVTGLPPLTWIEILEHGQSLNPRCLQQVNQDGTKTFAARVRSENVDVSATLTLTNGDGITPTSSYAVVLCQTTAQQPTCDPSLALSLPLMIEALPLFYSSATTKYNLLRSKINSLENKMVHAFVDANGIIKRVPNGNVPTIIQFRATHTLNYDITPQGIPDAIIVLADDSRICSQAFLAQFLRLYYRRLANINFFESAHDMQIQVSYSTLLLYNSILNAAVLQASTEKFHPCYLAKQADGSRTAPADMENFQSAFLIGGRSEGWSTAFFYDLFDSANERFTGDPTTGRTGQSDSCNGVSYFSQEFLDALGTLPDPGNVDWPFPDEFYVQAILPRLPQDKQGGADITAYYNYILDPPAAASCSASTSGSTSTRADSSDPLIASLSDAGICPSVIDGLSDDEMNTIRTYLRQWMADPGMPYSDNTGIIKLLKEPNINNNVDAVSVLKTFRPAQFDVLSNNGTVLTVRDDVRMANLFPPGVESAEVWDPLKVVDFTKILYNLVYRSQKKTFDLYMFSFWSKPSWDTRNFQGIMIVLYNNSLCNFMLASPQSFSTAVPDTSVCPFGPPVVTSIDTDSGKAAGGTLVTIFGYAFDASAVASIGGVDCQQTQFVSATQIVCVSPSGVGRHHLVAVWARSFTSTSTTCYFSYEEPSIAAVQPTVGSTSELYTVTITGANFGPGAAAIDFVTIGEENCTNIQHINDTSIICDMPPGIGMDNLVVLAVGGQKSTISYSVDIDFPSPEITAISPAVGTCEGGVPVTITGKNFGSFNETEDGLGRTIQIDNVFWFTDVQWLSDTTITAISPPGVGLNNIATISVDGNVGQGGQFSYPGPTIDLGQSLFAGTLGASVEVYGSNLGLFGFTNGIDLISLGGEAIGIDQDSSNFSCSSVAIAIPPGVGFNLPLYLVVGGQQSNTVLFSYYPPVVYSSNSTANGPEVELCIYGENFVPEESDDYYGDADISLNNVTIVTDAGTTLCNVGIWTSTMVNCSVPEGYWPINEIIVFVGGQASTGFVPPTTGPTLPPTPAPTLPPVLDPVVDSLEPNHGPTNGSTTITVHGSGFGDGSGSPHIYINGTECLSSQYVDAQTLACVTPPGTAANVSVEVGINGIYSPVEHIFSYDAPVVTSINPTSAPRSIVTITITGYNFGSGAPAPTVTLQGHGEATCSSPVLVDSTHIACFFGPTELNYSVYVNVAGQRSTQNMLFTFEGGAPPGGPPTMSSLSPTSGRGMVTLTITGSGFVAGATSVIMSGGGLSGGECDQVFVSSPSFLTCSCSGVGAVTVAVSVNGRTSPQTFRFTFVQDCTHPGC